MNITGGAVKALDSTGNRIGGYAVRFGSPQTPDLSPSRDFFTKSTDYMLERTGPRYPMLFHHGMDPDTADQPVIGTWTKAEIDSSGEHGQIGIWAEGILDMSHRYAAAIKKLIDQGILHLSSDSVQHLVKKAAKAGGVNEITRWPLAAISLTPTPADYLNPSVQALKSLMSHRSAEGAKAYSTDERMRLAALELDLLDLEIGATKMAPGWQRYTAVSESSVPAATVREAKLAAPGLTITWFRNGTPADAAKAVDGPSNCYGWTDPAKPGRIFLFADQPTSSVYDSAAHERQHSRQFNDADERVRTAGWSRERKEADAVKAANNAAGYRGISDSLTIGAWRASHGMAPIHELLRR